MSDEASHFIGVMQRRLDCWTLLIVIEADDLATNFVPSHAAFLARVPVTEDDIVE